MNHGAFWIDHWSWFSLHLYRIEPWLIYAKYIRQEIPQHSNNSLNIRYIFLVEIYNCILKFEGEMNMTIRVITGAEIEAEKKMIAALKTDRAAESVTASVSTSTEANKKDTLMDVLLKYIPVTVIILYTFLDSVFRAATPVPVVLWFSCFIILLIGAFVITYWITEGPEVDFTGMTQGKEDIQKIVKDWQDIINNQRIKQSGIAVIAFAGYVMCIGGPFTSLSAWQPYYGSVALVMAVLFVAMIAHKDLLAS